MFFGSPPQAAEDHDSEVDAMKRAMSARTVTVATLCAGLAVGAGAGPAAAAYAAPEIAWVNQNVVLAPDKSSAQITGKYRCVGGREGTHLWVSAKQGPRIDPDAGNTGSSYADAWYDTNYNFENDPAGLTVDCDGKWHVSRITVKPVFGTLARGPVWMQWCLFDNTSTEDNFPQGFVQEYGWRTVQGTA
jgi:hypothetical protein